MMAVKSDPNFHSEKARVLGKADLSRKGSVDEPITELVGFINSLKDFYTTSSCSGRLTVHQEEGEQKKKGCHWWLISHDTVSPQKLESALGSAVGSGEKSFAYFKFEPFVLHVICRTLEDAQNMMQVAVSSGFRNSGISCGKKGKIMVAVRSTQCLEVPVVHGDNMLVSTEYLRILVELGNVKMQDNLKRIERFFCELKELAKEKYSKGQPPHTQDIRRNGVQLSAKTNSRPPPEKEEGESHASESKQKDVNDKRELDLENVDVGNLFS